MGMPKKRPDPVQPGGDVPATELQSRFGRNLKAGRKRVGLTQVQVSSRSGISQSDISLIERGQVNLSLVTMQRLAKVIDHDVSNLLAQTQTQDTPSKK